MATEAAIADIAGIPFVVDDADEDKLIPLTMINESVLKEDADENALALAEKIIEEMEKVK